MVRRLRTTDCGKFESVGKYVFEHGEQDATSAEFSAGPLHYEKMDKLRSSSLRKPETNLCRSSPPPNGAHVVVCSLDPVEGRVPPSSASSEPMWRCVPYTQYTKESGGFHRVERSGMISSFQKCFAVCGAKASHHRLRKIRKSGKICFRRRRTRCSECRIFRRPFAP